MGTGWLAPSRFSWCAMNLVLRRSRRRRGWQRVTFLGVELDDLVAIGHDVDFVVDGRSEEAGIRLAATDVGDLGGHLTNPRVFVDAQDFHTDVVGVPALGGDGDRTLVA